MRHEVAARGTHGRDDERAAEHGLRAASDQHEGHRRGRRGGHVARGEREAVFGRGAGEPPPVEVERRAFERPRTGHEVFEHDVRGERAQAEGDEHADARLPRALEQHEHEREREEARALLADEAHGLEQRGERETGPLRKRMQRSEHGEVEGGEHVVEPSGREGHRGIHRHPFVSGFAAPVRATDFRHETMRRGGGQATVRHGARVGRHGACRRLRPGLTNAGCDSR